MGEEGKTDADYAAENAERDRRDRHHDVLCLVLKASGEYIAPTDADPQNSEDWARRVVKHAHFTADLAYPPPPCSNCARVGCKGCGGERIEGPFSSPPKAEEP